MRASLIFFMCLLEVTLGFWSIADLVVYWGIGKAKSNWAEAERRYGCPRNESRIVDEDIVEKVCEWKRGKCTPWTKPVAECFFGHLSVQLDYDSKLELITSVKGSRKTGDWKDLWTREDVDRLLKSLCPFLR